MLVRSLSFPQNDEPRLAITDSEGRNCGVLVVVNRFEPMYGFLCEHKAGFFLQESESIVQLTQTRAVSTFLPILCLIVIGRKLDRPSFEQSAHLLARSRRVHASISREVPIHDWA